MILAVTMNPSVDISYRLCQLKLNDVNRVNDVHKTAGGKGLNVARVISLLGGDVLATGVLGGTTGDFIASELARTHINSDFLRIQKESRNCIAILHEGKQTEILESGPTLDVHDGIVFLEKYKSLLNSVSLVTISGSLPKGLEASFYQEMLTISGKKGIPVIMDSSGEALKKVLTHEIKPLVVKPNITELSQLLEVEVDGKLEGLKHALQHEMFTGIEWVVVSMGSEGAFVRHAGDYYRARVPKIQAVNPVGSGDATVAGLAYALNQKGSVETVLKIAMTTGILNSLEASTGFIDKSNFEKYFDEVEVIKID